MLWASQTHTASATIASVRLDHWFPDGPCLCVAQHSGLAFYALSDGPATKPLACLVRIPLRARVLAMHVLPASSSAMSDVLLILTDHPVPRLLVLRRTAPSDEQDPRRPNPWSDVHTEATLLLQDSTRPAADMGLGMCIEPPPAHSRRRYGRWAAAYTHTGQLRLLPLKPMGPSTSPVPIAEAFHAR